MNYIGLVLCGGKSSRMGQDKGLMERKKGTWASYLREQLHLAGVSEVTFSVSEHNYSNYLEWFNKRELVLDIKLEHIPSSLVGILSFQQELKTNHNKQHIIVLACDLQLVNKSLITFLIDKFEQSKTDACVLTDGEFIQPFAGIYTFQGLSKLLKLVQLPKFQNKSMRYLLRQLDCCVVELPNNMKHQLNNFNTPQSIIDL